MAVANFAGAAGAAGPRGAAPAGPPPPSLTRAEPAPERAKKEKVKAFERRRQAWQAREKRRVAALSRWTAAEDARLAAGTGIGFSGFQDATYDGEVAVATNTPYVLGSVSAPVRLATYGDTPGAMSRPRRRAPRPRPGARPAAGRRCRASSGGLLERLHQQRRPGTGHPGQHQRPLLVPGAGTSRLRSCSGTTSTPRFLMASRPMPRSRSAALSCFSR